MMNDLDSLYQDVHDLEQEGYRDNLKEIVEIYREIKRLEDLNNEIANGLSTKTIL